MFFFPTPQHTVENIVKWVLTVMRRTVQLQRSLSYLSFEIIFLILKIIQKQYVSLKQT